jgi:hypothetical protein
MKKRFLLMALLAIALILDLVYMKYRRKEGEDRHRELHDMDRVITESGLKAAAKSPRKFSYETLIATLSIFVDHLMQNYTKDGYFKSIKAAMKDAQAVNGLISGVLQLIKRELVENPQSLALILEKQRKRRKEEDGEDNIFQRVNESFLLSLIYKGKNSENGTRIMKQVGEELGLILKNPELSRLENSVYFQLKMGVKSFRRGLIEYYYQWICSYLMELRELCR